MKKDITLKTADDNTLIEALSLCEVLGQRTGKVEVVKALKQKIIAELDSRKVVVG